MKKLPKLFALSLLTLPVAASAETLDELIQKGDVNARSFNEEAALKYYLAAAEKDSGNAYLYLAISREYRHLVSEATGKKEKLKLGNIALEYALKAAEAGPRDSDAQLAQAITYGKMLPLITGNGERLEASRIIKASADRALALNSKNDTAWHVLGKWHRGIAEIGGMKRMMGGLVFGKLPKSTYENAAECFKRAIELEPNRPMHYVELGCVYEAMGKEAEAKQMIERGLRLAETDKDDPTTKARGRDVLRSL